MPHVEVTRQIDADADAVYALLKRMEDFPEFMTDLESVRILERNGEETVSEWVGKLQGKPIRWVEREIFDDDNLKIRYEQIEGDLSVMEGEWVVEAADGATRVTLTCDFEFGLPMLSALLNPIGKMALTKNCEQMLEAIKEELE